MSDHKKKKLAKDNTLLQRLGIVLPEISYIICTAHRSGSSLLCEMLRQTRLAGRPKEFFLNWYLSVHSPQRLERPDSPGSSEWLLPPDLYLNKVFQVGTWNRVLGIKIMHSYFRFVVDQLREFIQDGACTDLEALEAVFPNLHFIYMRRENKIQQAVSHAKAVQSGEWHRFPRKPTDEAATEILSDKEKKDRLLTYDFDQIHAFYLGIVRGEQMWEIFFKTFRIEPLRITYESFSSNFEQVTIAILDFLGIEHRTHLALRAPERQQLRDNVSEDWSKRFTEELSEQNKRE